MCTRIFFSSVLVLAVLTSSVLAAPVNDQKLESKRSDSSVEPSGQTTHDDDLQALVNLVDDKASKDHVMVHKQETTHMENSNGKTSQVKETEEKVLDTITGDLIADVKQEVKQESSGGGKQDPETLVETEIDIPSAGIHKTVLQTGENDQSTAEGAIQGIDLRNDLSPHAMAEFLMSTQQFQLFYSSLEKLVNTSKLSLADAEDYARAVAMEYEQLENVYTQPQIVPYSRRYDTSADLDGPTYPDMSAEAPQDGYLQFIQQQQEEELPSLEYPMIPDDLDPYDFLSVLWEEAFERGNEEAQAIVQMLYDRVSEDANQDDVGQIRDMLVNTVASSLPSRPRPANQVQQDTYGEGGVQDGKNDKGDIQDGEKKEKEVKEEEEEAQEDH